jgi:hypothetical protein
MFGQDPAHLRMITLAHFHSLRYLFDGLVETQLSVILHVRPHSMAGGLLDGWAVRLYILFAAATTEVILDSLESFVSWTQEGER